jgi:hypothetical protein
MYLYYIDVTPVTGKNMLSLKHSAICCSISAQKMEQQKILYTHKHCEIIHIRNVRFLFSFFSI